MKINSDMYSEICYQILKIAEIVDLSGKSAMKIAQKSSEQMNNIISANEMMTIAIYCDGTSNSVNELLGLKYEIGE